MPMRAAPLGPLTGRRGVGLGWRGRAATARAGAVAAEALPDAVHAAQRASPGKQCGTYGSSEGIIEGCP
jgi:hypothetical protein